MRNYKHKRYKGLSLRSKIFWGFLVITILSLLFSMGFSFLILKKNALQLSKTDQQNKSDAVMAALDYAVSSSPISTEDIPKVLSNKIYEIGDINNFDIIIYDLKGNYLLSNKDNHLVLNKKLDADIVHRVLTVNERFDVEVFDPKIKANKISSYMLLRNNMLVPVAIVYFPYYHSDSLYINVFNKYVKYVLLVNLFIIGLSVLISFIISKNVTKALRKFSGMIARITLFENDLCPIRYFHNDELSSLIKSYNKMILQIQTQKERLTFIEKEHAWREMARQVAHEVKNPLTPMKLSIQNFERKFDPNDPDIQEKVKKMSSTLVEQIDLIASVANAFSQFAQLPEKYNETFDLNEEVKNILDIFSEEKINIKSNKEVIPVNMDKIYLNRIITNLITNAIQAKKNNEKLIINVNLEQIYKRIKISIQDNGVGISKDMLWRIFEPNFTSKNTGMGLGLTMVKKMVEDYKGEVTVESEVEKGTTFIVILPSNV